jgi:hypothetical protein
MSDEDDVGLERDETVDEVDDVDELHDGTKDPSDIDEALEGEDDISDLDDRELIKESDKEAKKEKVAKKPKQTTPVIKKKTIKKPVTKKKVAAKKIVTKKVVVKKSTPAKRAMNHYIKTLKEKKKAKVSKHKHKDKSKPGKRGPKGAQWRNWTIPYQESSIMGKLFTEAIKKGGIKIKDISKIAKKYGANPARALKYLRSGHSKGWVWNVDDSNNRVRVSNPRIGDKHWKKR